MKSESIRFPVYRKYKNDRSYFKILSLDSFVEVQTIGKKRIVHQIYAKIYPEKLFIGDLLFRFEEMAVEITEAEFLAEIEKAGQK